MSSRYERSNTPSAVYAQKRRDNENEARELLRARLPDDIVAESLGRRCDFNITTKVLAHALKCFDDSASLPDLVERSDYPDTGAYNRVRRDNEQTIIDSLKKRIPDAILAEDFMKLPHFDQTTKIIMASCKLFDQIRDPDATEAEYLEEGESYDIDNPELGALETAEETSLEPSKTSGTFVHDLATSRLGSRHGQAQCSIASSSSGSSFNSVAITRMPDQIREDGVTKEVAEPIWKCNPLEAATRASNYLAHRNLSHQQLEPPLSLSKDISKAGEKRKLPSAFEGPSDREKRQAKAPRDKASVRFHPVLEVNDFETAAKSLVSRIKQMLESVEEVGVVNNDARVREGEHRRTEIRVFADEDQKLLESVHDALVDAGNIVKATSLRRRGCENLNKSKVTWKRSGLLQEE